MQTLIKISDAAVIAIHCIDHMIKNSKEVYIAAEIAKELNVSYNHLSKILQLMAKHGFLKTIRGPHGGYSLTKKGEESTLKDIIELIDGKIQGNTCFMKTVVCKKDSCVLKDFLLRTMKDFEKTINTKIKKF
ncbi:MAG: Rrf2 family transcriptional regulator [Elusimicrobiota bacterium]